jgi:predicted nuclease of predicted toxin-antitoxin system
MTAEITYYMDQHVPKAITDGLRARGIDVLTASEDGNSKMPDPELLGRASALNRVLFTQDRDFLEIAANHQMTGENFSPIIFMDQNRLSYGACIAELELIAQTCSYAELCNQVMRLPV